MGGGDFCRAVIVSFVATFVATVYGYWETSFGLPRLDFATLLGQRLVPENSSREFAFTWGMAQHFIDSVLLGTLYVRFVTAMVSWPRWLSGFAYGLLVWTASGIVTSPLFRAGFFWWGWGGPALFGVLIWHLLWGFVLGLTYAIAEPEPGQRRKHEA